MTNKPEKFSFSFSWALESLKAGYHVRRRSWNDMWLVLVEDDAWKLTADLQPDDTNIRLLSWIGIRTADGGFVPWFASQTDILAYDWEEV